jgi:hypothetical protein
MPQDRNRQRGRKDQNQSKQDRSQSLSGSSSEQQSLRAREYRDEKGEIHHHTKTYMEQHRRDRE